MGALPKRKISKQRKNQRRSHDALDLPSLSTCPQCQSLKAPHKVCKACGVYNGVQVISVD
jgi:large subunit ribosomal protein L32